MRPGIKPTDIRRDGLLKMKKLKEIEEYEASDKKPRRVQRKRTKGWKMPPNTVYVGRPSKYGNPFYNRDATPADKRTLTYGFQLHLEEHGGIRRTYKGKETFTSIDEIKLDLMGKNLACWCKKDEACHADILLKIANE